MPTDPRPARRVAILVLALLIVGCSSSETSTPTLESPSATSAPSATDALSQADSNGTRVAVGMETRRAEVRTATAITATARESRRATQTAEVPVTQTAAAAYLATNQSIEAGVTQIPEQIAEWPLSPLTNEQLAEARACDFDGLFWQRYRNIATSDLPGPHPLGTPCEWAALAEAYIIYAPEADGLLELPAMAHYAYYMAVTQNPAYRLRNSLLYGFMGTTHVVEAPPISEQPVTRVSLAYSLGTIGYEAHALITIDDADTQLPKVSGYFSETMQPNAVNPATTEQEITGTINPGLLQSLGASLTDLVPIDAPFDTIACTDYYPHWYITLIFADGAEAEVTTLSNMLDGGGPWHVEINGQHFIQYGYGIPEALRPITEELEIHSVSTSVVCAFLEHEIIDLAFPNR